MAFTQPSFIRKNTPELRKKLKELGYEFNGADHIELDCIVTFPHHDTFGVFTAYHFNIYDDSFKTVWKGYIDCGTNEELFLALAALRDDSDYMQWFVTEKDEWVKCEREHFYQEHLTKTWRTWHKATVEEIIEYFKDK